MTLRTRRTTITARRDLAAVWGVQYADVLGAEVELALEGVLDSEKYRLQRLSITLLAVLRERARVKAAERMLK